jgi:IMP dehydrogenase
MKALARGFCSPGKGRTLGAKNLKEMQQVEVVIAPSLLTEGKVYQKAQQLGMGK